MGSIKGHERRGRIREGGRILRYLGFWYAVRVKDEFVRGDLYPLRRRCCAFAGLARGGLLGGGRDPPGPPGVWGSLFSPPLVSRSR